MRRTSLLAAGLVAVTALVLLAGCASIPGDGAVTAGLPFDQEQDAGEYLRLPASPVKDATPEEIVEGFIAAATGSQNDYEVARQFLTEAAAAAWDPTAGATISLGRPQAEGEESLYEVTVAAVGTVDDSGHYTEQSSESVTFDYGVIQSPDTGQWRIDNVPDGLLLTRTDFDDAFDEHALYFFEPSYRYLVPDPRWFPRGTSTATRIVNALLAGPSPWFSGGVVVSSLPEGAKLSVNAVTITSGRALVDLSEVPSSVLGLQRLRAQLSASLSELNTVSVITVSVNQNEVNIPEFEADTAPQRDPVVLEQRPLVVRGGVAGLENSGGLADFAGMAATVTEQQPRALIFDESAGVSAVLGAEGAVLVRDVGARMAVPGSGIVDIALDNNDFVWAAAGKTISVGNGSSQATTVAARWLESATILAIELSQDAARLLVLSEVDGKRVLQVAGVVRDEVGRPVSLGVPQLVPTLSASLVDASWAGERNLAVLVALPGGSVAVRSYDLGGRYTELGTVPGAVRVVGGSTATSVLVRDSEERLWRLAATNWRQIADDIDELGEIR